VAARNLGGDFVSNASLSIVIRFLLPLWGGLPALRAVERCSITHSRGGRSAPSSLAPDPR
jgi:hypothetical protein